MKKLSIFLTLTLLMSVSVFAQYNALTISGGYSFADVDASDYPERDQDLTGTGWRINGLYEYTPIGTNVAWGFSFGYISVKANDNSGLDTTEYKVSTVPLYFAPKYMFGKKEKFKGFVKGALGVQFADLKRTGAFAIVEANDIGFYLGGSAGLNFFLNEKFFLNFEYELAYMTNSYYRNGWINSAMGGIGFKF